MTVMKQETLFPETKAGSDSVGFRYDYARRGVDRAEQAPSFLDALRPRIGAFARRAPEEFKQIGVIEYRPGAGIGWHRDKPEFGDVVGISLLSAVRMRLRKRSGRGCGSRFF